MIRYYFVWIVLACFTFSLSAQDYCLRIMEDVNQAIKMDSLDLALQRLKAVEECDFRGQLITYRQQAQERIFKAINEQKLDAFREKNAAVAARDEARQRELEAKSAAFAARAQEMMATNPTIALNLALAAYKTYPTSQAANAISYVLNERRTVFYASRKQLSLETYTDPRVSDYPENASPPPFFSISPDGSKLIFHLPEDEVSTVLDIKNGSDIQALELDDAYEWDEGYDRASHQFAPDGSFIIVQWRGDTGCIIDLTKEKQGQVLKEWQDGEFKTYALSVSGSKLLLAKEDSIQVWNTANFEPELVIPFKDSDLNYYDKLAISNDGRKFLKADENKLYVWEITKADTVRAVGDYEFLKTGKDAAWIESATFSPDGQKIAVVTNDHRVHLVKATEQFTFFTLDQTWADLSFNQTDLLAGWEQELRQYSSPKLISASFSPDGSKLITLARFIFFEPFVKVWNIEDGKEWFSLNGLEGLTYSADFSPDNQYITTTSALLQVLDDGDGNLIEPEIIKWFARPWHEPITISEERAGGTVQFSSQGTSIVTTNNRDDPKVYDLKNGTQITWEELPGGTVTRQSSSTLIPAYNEQNELWLWQLTAEQKMSRSKLGGIKEKLQLISIASQNNILAGSKAGRLYLWDTENREQPKIVESHPNEITAITCSPDGSKVYSSGKDRKIRIWDAVNGKASGEWQVDLSDGDHITSMTISPDGRLLAVGSSWGIVKLWRLVSGSKKETASWNQLDNSMQVFNDFAIFKSLNLSKREIEDLDILTTCLRFSPDSKRLLLATYDETFGSRNNYNKGLIRCWDISTQTALFTLTGKNRFEQLEYSPDGALILSLDNTGKVQVWTDPIGSLRNGKIYRLTPAQRKEYGITVDGY